MYIEIDEGYHGHRKTLRLCGLMQMQEADTYPIRLWQWACRSAPDGDLTGMEPYEIELALRYRMQDGKLYTALVKAGFIDELPDGRVVIHNWMERTGKSIESMAVAAAAKRSWRLHKEGKCTRNPETCEPCRKEKEGLTKRAGDVPDLSADCPRTVPGQSVDSPPDVPGTVPTKTRQDKARQAKPVQKEEECAETGRPAPAPAVEPPVITFPTDGRAKEWHLVASFVAEMRAAFPSLDVEGECRKALLYVRTNPAKRKTFDGMPKFLFGWMSRAQNGSGARASPGIDHLPRLDVPPGVSKRDIGNAAAFNAFGQRLLGGEK